MYYTFPYFSVHLLIVNNMTSILGLEISRLTHKIWFTWTSQTSCSPYAMHTFTSTAAILSERQKMCLPSSKQLTPVLHPT